jgi:CO/xanthine dehydrogenase Mo-binding subunit
VKEQVLSAAATLLGVPAEKLDAKANVIFVIEGPDKSIPWEEAATAFFSENGPLVGKGHYSPPEGLGGDYKGAAVGTSPAYSFSAAVCEVEVDIDTGKIKVLHFWDAHDCGTAINPLAVEGQVEGAVVMGMSETLLENEVFDGTGRVANPDLHNYLIATSADSPRIDSFLVDSYEPEGPFGAKEVGEGATLPVLGAIANAVTDAIGARIYDLPITPEKVLNAIKQNNPE